MCHFFIFAQNIVCGYPQSMFLSKNKKNMYTPVNPNLTISKWGVRGYTIHGPVIMMDGFSGQFNHIFDVT